MSEPSHSRCRAGEQIVLVPHDPRWSDGFEREAELLRSALSGVSIESHHIGSTAIPGIVAKPVIDMIGVVASVDVVDEHAHRLVAIGYDAMREFGIAGRRYIARLGGRRC